MGPQRLDRPVAGHRGSLADEVAIHVRDQILRGSLRPGTKIDQQAIAERLALSRSPIREALVILAQEGLLDLSPRRGAFVAELTPDDIVDHYELFGVIAGRAAAFAARSLDAAGLADLTDIHDRLAAAEPHAQAELNQRFHWRINTGAPRRTRWLLRHLGRSIPAGFYEVNEGWHVKATAHHAAILGAIVDGDAPAARALMEEHLHESGVAAVASLEQVGFWEV